MTPICVPVFVTVEGAVRGVRAAMAAGAGMIELRCDVGNVAEMGAALKASDVPVIVTVRPKWEGGESLLTDLARLEVMLKAVELGANIIDVEWVAWMRTVEFRTKLWPRIRERDRRLIISSHDFEGKFEKSGGVEKRLAELRAVGDADILKLVWMGKSVEDGVKALALCKREQRDGGRPLLALAMGEFGQVSRLLGAKYEMPFTFAAMGDGGSGGSAPGQPSIGELVGMYRWEEQTAVSPVYGVVGWPVGHSLSPAVHNAGLAACGLPGTYVPLAVRESYEEFAGVVDALRAAPRMHLRGLSITIPHKENALRYVRERGGTVDEWSGHIGAVNTMVFGEGGGVHGLNSDFTGALNALVGALKIELEGLKGKRVAILGAGGAARAIVAGLAHFGATVVIYNRTLERAKRLAAEFNGKNGKVVAAAWEKICDSCCEVYVNCTPLGMHPKVEETPMEEVGCFGPGIVVFDTIYNPMETRLLRMARERGATTIAGIEMFVGQAAVQFAVFTGRAAPVEVFYRVMMEKLGGRM